VSIYLTKWFVSTSILFPLVDQCMDSQGWGPPLATGKQIRADVVFVGPADLTLLYPELDNLSHPELIPKK